MIDHVVYADYEFYEYDRMEWSDDVAFLTVWHRFIHDETNMWGIGIASEMESTTREIPPPRNWCWI